MATRAKGRWAQGIQPRNFAWIVKDRLAVCERPGGYGPNHRRVRRMEEIIWLREQGFGLVISIIPSPHNLHNYDELGLPYLHRPFSTVDDPRNRFVAELEEEKFQSLLSVPVAGLDGDVIGAITMHTEAPREFTANEVELLTSTASLVGGAIENARLYEETRQRVEELEHLTELAETLARAQQLGDVLPAVAERTRRLLRSRSCHLYLLESSSEEFVGQLSRTCDDAGVAGALNELERIRNAFVASRRDQAPTADPSAAPRFPGFTVIEKLGQGGFGAVWRARDEKLEREVALKVLLPRPGLDPRAREEFLREARALARLRHPNVLAIHAVLEEGERIALALELVELGGSVEEQRLA